MGREDEPKISSGTVSRLRSADNMEIILTENETEIMPPAVAARRVPFFGKARPLEDLLRDSAFPYQVGRLVGASEVVAFYLQQQHNEEVAQMGVKLHSVVEFFYEPR
jgi:hypothetical protein